MVLGWTGRRRLGKPAGTLSWSLAMPLLIETLRPGDGAEAIAGKSVTVHYVGTLTSGSTFDSSRSRGQGFTFRLGAGMVIAGWDQGVAGMKVGELR